MNCKTKPSSTPIIDDQCDDKSCTRPKEIDTWYVLKKYFQKKALNLEIRNDNNEEP